MFYLLFLIEMLLFFNLWIVPSLFWILCEPYEQWSGNSENPDLNSAGTILNIDFMDALSVKTEWVYLDFLACISSYASVDNLNLKFEACMSVLWAKIHYPFPFFILEVKYLHQWGW